MSILLTAAIIMGLTAVFSLLNERLLGLQQTIGLVVIALVSTLGLALLNAAGIGDHFTAVRDFVAELALNETLLNGVLCFILFAGSINVKSETLREERWVIIALAIGATLIDSFTFERKGAGESGKRTKTYDNVSVSHGDTVALVGTRQSSAYARVDKLVLRPLKFSYTSLTYSGSAPRARFGATLEY